MNCEQQKNINFFFLFFARTLASSKIKTKNKFIFKKTRKTKLKIENLTRSLDSHYFAQYERAFTKVLYLYLKETNEINNNNNYIFAFYMAGAKRIEN